MVPQKSGSLNSYTWSRVRQAYDLSAQGMHSNGGEEIHRNIDSLLNVLTHPLQWIARLFSPPRLSSVSTYPHERRKLSYLESFVHLMLLLT
jgi:hypothetical protein